MRMHHFTRADDGLGVSVNLDSVQAVYEKESPVKGESRCAIFWPGFSVAVIADYREVVRLMAGEAAAPKLPPSTMHRFRIPDGNYQDLDLNAIDRWSKVGGADKQTVLWLKDGTGWIVDYPLHWVEETMAAHRRRKDQP